jgi:hypothetical protein
VTPDGAGLPLGGFGNSILIPILAGALLGMLFVVAVRRLGNGGETRALALGLVSAALIYVILVVPGGDGRRLALESAGVALFGGIAWFGLRAPVWLALGWVAHVGWDLGLHLDRAQSVVGWWYPLGCVGFDLIVAGFLLGAVISGGRARREGA